MKILVTAGPTWAKIDAVRILTNRFSGRTGLYLARQLAESGHQVSLLINPHAAGEDKGLEVSYFYYFDEFRKKIKKILEKNRYDAIIHTAAVNDYLPEFRREDKIASGQNNLNISLVRAEKIIKSIRRLAKKAVLIQFKLETKKEGIIDKAYTSLKDNGSDYAVANVLPEPGCAYSAFLIAKDKTVARVGSKQELAQALAGVIQKSRQPAAKNKN